MADRGKKVLDSSAEELLTADSVPQPNQDQEYVISVDIPVKGRVPTDPCKCRSFLVEL